MAEHALRLDAVVNAVVRRTQRRIVAEHPMQRLPTTIRHTPPVAHPMPVHPMPARRMRQAAEHRTAAVEHPMVVAAVEVIARPLPQRAD